MSSGMPTGGMKRQLDEYEDPGAKRLRPQQSRVVFVRGLPSDCLESELLALCCPFAVVEKSLLIPIKCQAFVQLPDVESAANLITFYQSRDAMIRGKKIYFEFSSREEITVRPSSGNGFDQVQITPTNASAPAPARASAVAASQDQQQQQQAQQYQLPAYTHDDGHRRGAGQANTILMVMVSKIEYDVTVDVLQQVFQKFGNVQKIVTFWKNNEFKALIQMESVDQAQAAQGALDGREIYTGCNQLSIVFSRHPELRVRFNNERSWDYTNPNLPPGPSGSAPEQPNDLPPQYDQQSARVQGLIDNFQPQQQQQQRLGERDRDRERDRGYGPPPSQQQQQRYEPAPSARDAYDYNRGPPGAAQPAYGRDDPYRQDPRDTRGLPRYADSNGPPMDVRGPRDFPRQSQTGLPAHSTGRSMRPDSQRSAVLICSNMERALVSPDRLFTFFGCFGDVIRVKIMFRKQDTALIQFVDEVHATSALDHLDGVFIFGKKLRVDYSKHTNVSMPRGEVDRFELENTRDFSNSPLHRYRRRSPQEAVSPCPLLHISGIPMDLQRRQNALVDMFAQFGFVADFHFIQKNTKMALVTMGSTDEAVMALLNLDNMAGPDSHMRVSFSKAFQYGAPGGGGGPPGPLPSAGSYSLPTTSGPGPQRHPRDRSRDRSRDRPPMGNRDRSGGPPRDRPFRDREPRDRRGPPPRY